MRTNNFKYICYRLDYHLNITDSDHNLDKLFIVKIKPLNQGNESTIIRIYKTVSYSYLMYDISIPSIYKEQNEKPLKKKKT